MSSSAKSFNFENEVNLIKLDFQSLVVAYLLYEVYMRYETGEMQHFRSQVKTGVFFG